MNAFSLPNGKRKWDQCKDTKGHLCSSFVHLSFGDCVGENCSLSQEVPDIGMAM